MALPLAELARRRTDLSALAGYADDFIAGGLLLWAALAVSRGRPGGPVRLVAAWGVLCGGLYGSFFGQLEGGLPLDVSGLSTGTVLWAKGLLFGVALAALARSLRAACPPASA
jgi:hypothetical protein